MRRLALLTAALVALVVGAGGVGGVAAAQTTAPSAPGSASDAVAAADADIARLSQQADALAEQYFDTLGRLAETQQHIDEIESRIPALTEQVADLRARTLDRAVAAYKRAGNDLTTIASAGDPLEVARRVQWLDRLNARDDALVADLQATTARLADQRSQLQVARGEAAAALDEVKHQGAEIDALLADAQERRRIALTPPTTAAPAPEAASAPSEAVAGSPPAATAPTASPPAAPPPSYVGTPGTHPRHDEPFLVCTRAREAGGNYAAYNPAGPYMGAYQFLQSTWNGAANHAGRPDLIGVPPHTASPYDQDELAWSLYTWQGSGPWGGLCDGP